MVKPVKVPLVPGGEGLPALPGEDTRPWPTPTPTPVKVVSPRGK